MRETGTVKKWVEDKGFGFITRDADRDSDAFVHYSAIAGEGRGRRSLREGQRVSFELEEGEKGLRAVEVREES